MWKKKYSTMTTKLSKLNTSLIKKSIITTLIVSTLTVQPVGATDEHASSIDTMYHIYLSDQYLGAVSDRAAVEEIIETKVNLASEEYGMDTVDVAEPFTYVPEQVFSEEVDDASVLEKVANSIEIQAEAVALEVNGKAIAYVKNSEAAEEVMKSIQLLYVSEEEFTKWKKESQASTPLPSLKDDEARIIDISFNKEVDVKETKIDPVEILSVEDAIAFLTKGTREEKIYEVQKGDVLGSIADEHDLSTSELLSLNNGMTEDAVLQIGQSMNVTAYEPVVHVEITKEMKTKEIIPYTEEVINDDGMYKGDSTLQQEGKDGERSVTYSMTSVNGVEQDKTVKKERILTEAVNRVVVMGTKEIPSRGTGSFIWPTNGGYISSHMGPRWGTVHKGMDIARPNNLTIKAVDNGIVTSAGWDNGGYGNKVVVDHQNGFVTVYAHLKSIHVKKGQTVPQGTSLGLMGTTGQSTGVHLHIEIYKNGRLVDPHDYL
ncbi:M23 family metallopeptidase [Bacillus spongiae]|uniref:M23 family metallopeptidase n=1 Tax=Bacillus spongiae TaxID=2683610 RepID=A0ABU8HGJ2_9BACI